MKAGVIRLILTSNLVQIWKFVDVRVAAIEALVQLDGWETDVGLEYLRHLVRNDPCLYVRRLVGRIAGVVDGGPFFWGLVS